MKILIAIVLLLGLAGAGWWSWKQMHPRPVKYETVAVSRGELTQAVTATGQLNPVVNITIGSQISGNVAKVFTDYNAVVTKGELVAQIETAPYTAALHMAQANVASARAALELAQITAKRKEALVKEHAAAQADLDTAVANLHQAEAILQIQEANQESAQVNLDHCNITSPIKGVVISRNVEVGETVAAAMNAPVLFTLAGDLAKMQIDASVAEADVGELLEGQHANFTVDAYPYRTFQGTVTQVRNSPVTVQNVVTYDTVISVNNDDLKLRPGMTANLSIVIAHRDNVLRIPNAALRYKPSNAPVKPVPGTPPPGARPSPGARVKRDVTRTVYVLADGAAKPAPVQVHLGISDGIETEALDGVHLNDQLVTGVISTDAAPVVTRPQGGGFGGMRRPF